MNIMQQIRLSQLSHGGGCGCKLAPSVLQQLLSSHPTATRYKLGMESPLSAERHKYLGPVRARLFYGRPEYANAEFCVESSYLGSDRPFGG